MDQSSRIFDAIVWLLDPVIAAVGKRGKSKAGVLGDAILLSFVEYHLVYESYEMRMVWLARRGGEV